MLARIGSISLSRRFLCGRLPHFFDKLIGFFIVEIILFFQLISQTNDIVENFIGLAMNIFGIYSEWSYDLISLQ